MKLVCTTFKSDEFNKRFRGNKKLHLPKIRNIFYTNFDEDYQKDTGKVLYGIFKMNKLFIDRKCSKMILKSHFKFFQLREL